MSTPETAKKVWHNGKLVDWDDAKIHVMSHVIHYASALFEGIRCYATPQGPGDIQAERTHPAPSRLMPHLSDGPSVFGGRAHDSVR